MSDYQEGYYAGYEDASAFMVECYQTAELAWRSTENALMDQIDALTQQLDAMDWRRATAQRKYEETQQQLVIEREKNG